MNWQTWLQGLGVAMASGVATTITSGNITPENYKSAGVQAGINAVICGVLYIVSSPKDKRKGNEERRKR